MSRGLNWVSGHHVSGKQWIQAIVQTGMEKILWKMPCSWLTLECSLKAYVLKARLQLSNTGRRKKLEKVYYSRLQCKDLMYIDTVQL